MASLGHRSILGHNGLFTFMRILLSAFWEFNLLEFILKYSMLLFEVFSSKNCFVHSTFSEFWWAVTPKGAAQVVVFFIHDFDGHFHPDQKLFTNKWASLS